MSKYQLLITTLCTLTLSVNSYSLVVGVVHEDFWSNGNCYPLGCSESAWGSVYQQAYDSSEFGSAFLIESISFYLSPVGHTGEDPQSGSYMFEFSTTNSAIDALSSITENNLGDDNVLVYSGEVEDPTLSNGQLNIYLDLPFHYDPGLGNLLLTISSENASESLTFYEIAHSNWDGVSRVYSNTADTGGLVTGFNEVTEVPAPSAAWLFGTAIVLMIRKLKIRPSSLQKAMH